MGSVDLHAQDLLVLQQVCTRSDCPHFTQAIIGLQKWQNIGTNACVITQRFNGQFRIATEEAMLLLQQVTSGVYQAKRKRQNIGTNAWVSKIHSEEVMHNSNEMQLSKGLNSFIIQSHNTMLGFTFTFPFHASLDHSSYFPSFIWPNHFLCPRLLSVIFPRHFQCFFNCPEFQGRPSPKPMKHFSSSNQISPYHDEENGQLILVERPQNSNQKSTI